MQRSQMFLILAMTAAFIAIVKSKNADQKLEEISAVKDAWKSACPLLLSPALGRFKESNVDIEAAKDAELEGFRVEEQFLMDSRITTDERYEDYLIKQSKVNENSQKIVDSLKALPIANHFCNPAEFALLIDNMEEPITCEQVCLHCIPGSYPVCYAKNRRFPGVARTCLCTYNFDDPINAAAFALKSIPVPKISEDARHRGKSKRELLLSKIAKSILFL